MVFDKYSQDSCLVLMSESNPASEALEKEENKRMERNNMLPDNRFRGLPF
jgi:hypothetical protein